MPNPFQAFSNGGMPGSFGNIQQMIQSFNQFRNTFKGNPQEVVQNMLNSGQLSQERFNQAQQMAKQFQDMIGKMKV